jgi:hypothetical protein
MGMTDKQFFGYVRLILDDIKSANEETEMEAVKKKLIKIIESLQATIEE